MLTKEHILTALDRWIRQRPGLEFGNYGDVKAYRSELRQITKDKHDAERLLRAVALRESITGGDLSVAFQHAYSGRLTLTETPDGRAKLAYCTGQYWPTEYRKAAAAVLASVLWAYFRDKCMPAPNGTIMRQYGRDNPATGEFDNINGQTPGDWLRDHARREFGRSIQQRWFN